MDGEDRTPGPVDPSVLTLQGTHRSVAVWDQTVILHLFVHGLQLVEFIWYMILISF